LIGLSYLFSPVIYSELFLSNSFLESCLIRAAHWHRLGDQGENQPKAQGQATMKREQVKYSPKELLIMVFFCVFVLALSYVVYLKIKLLQ